ncbi:MAG: hypothetical protein ACE5IA_00410 [Dehalococcoidia bacterium]
MTSQLLGSSKGVVWCANRHGNPEDSTKCTTCGLPIVNYQGELDLLLEKLASKALLLGPRRNVFMGVGSIGGVIVHDFHEAYGETVSSASFLVVDSIEEGEPAPPDSGVAKGMVTLNYNIVGPTGGGMTYGGLAQRIALADPGLDDSVRRSGVRETDERQAIFLISALGGGTGSGVGPVVGSKCAALNPEASVVAIAIIPSSDEADHIQFNAYSGVSRLLRFSDETAADMILMLDYDRLRQIRGVGRGGVELRSEALAVTMLKCLVGEGSRSEGQVDPTRIARMSRAMKVQMFIPCLAIGRSMAIFGNLANVLESALAFPLAMLDRNTVTISYLFLRVPQRLARLFHREFVREEFDRWNKDSLPNIRESLFDLAYLDDPSDRVDACLLLGGSYVDLALGPAKRGFARFRNYLSRGGQWESCGVDPAKVQEALDVIGLYDQRLKELRET